MPSSVEPVIYSTDKFLEENQQFFEPPVCNRMMHNEGQMKLFFVGGPNIRKDYHIEEGEELFYMIRGDMCLKVVEHGKHRDIPIKEGQIFLLPARVAHSPQRKENTVGFVIERERLLNERDGLRYFTERDGKPTMDTLYEEWFYCEDLGTQLAPVINRFFSSEQYKTGKPLPVVHQLKVIHKQSKQFHCGSKFRRVLKSYATSFNSISKDCPVVLDDEVTVGNPFHLQSWIENHRSELNSKGFLPLFGDSNQFKIGIYGKGENSDQCDRVEIWIWQIEGHSVVTVNDKEYTVNMNESMLIKAGQRFSSKRSEGSVALICYQDPARKNAK